MTDLFPDSDIGFDEFWRQYPRKVAKAAAQKAYQKACKTAGAGEILQGAMRYAAARTGHDPRYTLHGASWLNGMRWNDPQENFHEPPRTLKQAGEDLIARAEEYERQGYAGAHDHCGGSEQGGDAARGPVRIAARSRS